MGTGVHAYMYGWESKEDERSKRRGRRSTEA